MNYDVREMAKYLVPFQELLKADVLRVKVSVIVRIVKCTHH